MSVLVLLNLAAALLAGLNAGLFTAFTIAVMPGLRTCDDAAFVQVMRAVNRAILNGRFLAVFLGTPLVAAAAALGWLLDGAGTRAGWAAAGLVLAVVTVLTTGAVNVPLNNQLEETAAGGDTAARHRFEARWVRWNTFRTVTSCAAFAALLAALAQ